MVLLSTTWSYLEPFLITKEQLHLAEISQKLGKNHSQVRRYLNQLEKEGILKKSYKGRLTLYKLNTGHPQIIDVLVAAEKEKIIKKCERDPILKEATHHLQKAVSENQTTILFGSAVNDAKSASDIDILIVGQEINREKLNDFQERHQKLFHVINVESLDSVKNNLKNEVMNNHLLINNSEGAVKWMLR